MIRSGRCDARAREVAGQPRLQSSPTTTKYGRFESAARPWRAPVPQGGGAAASWPPVERQVAAGRTAAARARSKRHHVCFKAGAGLLQRADAGDARGHRRYYKGNQGWRRCYKKPPPLLHVSASVATSGRHIWYIRPPVLVRSSSAVATSSHRCCYIRLPVLLRSSSAAATSGRRCYMRPPSLLRPVTAAATSASAATGGRLRCYVRPSPLLHRAAAAAIGGRLRCYARSPPLLHRAATATGEAASGVTGARQAMPRTCASGCLF
jgi:hypothetical protein